MRHVQQPGPAHPERVQALTARVRPVQVELPRGATLLDALAEAVGAQGVASAVFSLRDLPLEPMAFVMPALSDTPRHVAYFSERHEAAGPTRIDAGSVTFGRREGQPTLHCHAAWTESDGRRRSGHVLPAESRLRAATAVQGWMLEGAAFEVQPDAETNFSLLQVAAASEYAPAGDGSRDALAVRVRPNEDLCHALEALCATRGIRRGRIRGGVGSLIGTEFEDGRRVEPFATEVFIRRGVIAPGADGATRADIDVGLVAHTGEMAEGRLARGRNPVLITFELVIEVEEGL